MRFIFQTLKAISHDGETYIHVDADEIRSAVEAGMNETIEAIYEATEVTHGDEPWCISYSWDDMIENITKYAIAGIGCNLEKYAGLHYGDPNEID